MLLIDIQYLYFHYMSNNTGTSTAKIAGHHLEIVGINANDCSGSCSKHKKCRVIVNEGGILCLTLVSLTVNDVEEKTIAAGQVKGGCLVGYT